MAQGGAQGAAGGVSSTTAAITRLEVVDPHLVITMRDVMSTTDTAPRLTIGARAGGGGGGGGGASTGTGTIGNPGQPTSPYAATSSALLKSSSAGGGLGGSGRGTSSYQGGAGRESISYKSIIMQLKN